MKEKLNKVHKKLGHLNHLLGKINSKSYSVEWKRTKIVIPEHTVIVQSVIYGSNGFSWDITVELLQSASLKDCVNDYNLADISQIHTHKNSRLKIVYSFEHTRTVPISEFARQ